jgi:putative membrane protein
MWQHGMRYIPYGVPFFNVFHLLGVVLFILLFFWIISILFNGSHYRDMESKKEEEMEDDTAIQILRERYAKGEITKRQFTDMKKDLE